MERRRILQLLVSDGKLDPLEAERTARDAEQAGENVLDRLIDSNILGELELLKAAAAYHRTQYIGTEKLVRAPIERAVLEAVPARLVERFGALPILFDRRTQTLSVALADLDQLDVDKEISLATNIRVVRCYAARPRTVRALIRRWYYGDSKPLNALLEALRTAPKPVAKPVVARPAFEDYGMVDDDLPVLDLAPPKPLDTSIGIDFPGFDAAPAPAPRPAPAPAPAPAIADDFEDIPGFAELIAAQPSPPTPSAPKAGPPPFMPGLAAPVNVAPPSAAPPIVAPQSIPSATKPAPIVLPEFRLPSISPTAEPKPEKRASAFESLAPPPSDSKDSGQGSAELETLLETASVLVALLEHDRGERRGQSAQVARLTRKVVERIGVDAKLANAIVLAAHLHDVGKPAHSQITALGAARSEAERAQAQKSHLAPIRLFEAARLPRATMDSIAHHFERFDGTGFPDRLVEREIPLGARVLSAVKSYVAITTPSETRPTPLGAREACDVLALGSGTIFDPTVVDLVRLLVLGDDLDRKLDASTTRILLVEPDPEETTILEMRLRDRGYEVAIARDAEAALSALEKLAVDLVVTEVELPRVDGFRLLQRLRSERPNLPMLVVTKRGDRASVDQGFALGVVDYLVKPASADVIAAKVAVALDSNRRAVTSSVKGVAGQLSEMPLPDVVQIFGSGRRTGRMTIRAKGRAGEIHFRDGLVFDATFGSDIAHEAVYAMLALEEGEFELDSSFVPEENRINASSESLLLEGMRRLDEARR